jgi:hypothetical protein
MLLEMLPYITGAGALFNDVPILPNLADARLSRTVNAYTQHRYGVTLTKQQALTLFRGEEISYDTPSGQELISLLRPNTALETRDLVRHITVTKTKGRAQPEIVHQQKPYPELAKYRDERKKDKDKKPQQNVSVELAVAIQRLREEMAEHTEDIPAFFPSTATEIFDLLDEIIGDFDGGIYNVEQKYTIEATIRDYMPTLMNNAIALPRSFFRGNANTKPAQDIFRQLKVILDAVKAIHQVKYDGIVRAIEEQGLFLDARFGVEEPQELNLEQK